MSDEPALMSLVAVAKAIAGTLPFDLEPASFLLVQTAKVST